MKGRGYVAPWSREEFQGFTVYWVLRERLGADAAFFRGL